MLKTIAIVIAGIVVVFVAAVLVIAAGKPDTFRVQRSATIQAPPEKIYPLIEDFHRWALWSPWEKKDPAMKRTFSGAASGKGAVYTWDGDKNVGQGSMEITEATAPSKVALKLDFLEPFEAHNQVEFIIVPRGSASEVTWTMIGPANFLTKIMHVFFDMDRMVGGDFEAGLAALKAAAEA